MVSMFFLFLIVAWAAGIATGNTLGGLIHLLPVLAVATFAVRVIVGRKAYLRCS
jgi:hypothetical protein